MCQQRPSADRWSAEKSYLSLFKVQRVPPTSARQTKNPQVCTIRERLSPAAVVLRRDRIPETIVEIVGFVLVPRRPQQPIECDGKSNLISCDFLFPFHVLIFVIIFRNIHTTSPPIVLNRTMAFLVCSFFTLPPYTFLTGVARIAVIEICAIQTWLRNYAKIVNEFI